MATFTNINVGTAPNDGTGSSLREAFRITNNNFVLLSNVFPDATNVNVNVTSTGTSTFEQINANVIYSSTVGNAGTLYYGNIATAAQPNITSLGTLIGLTVSGNTTLQQTTVENTLLANSTLTAASTFFAQADVNFQGQQKVNVNVISGTYTLANSDYLLIANVASNANCTITLSNADLSVGRTFKVIYFDPDGTNSNTTVVSLQVESGAGNIVVGPYTFPQLSYNLPNDINRNSLELVSNGVYWFIL